MNIDKQIEFDKVKEIWAELAITDYAKEQIRETTICLSENELRKLLRDTTSAKEMIEKLGTPPLQNITEIKDVLQIVEKGEETVASLAEKLQVSGMTVRRDVEDMVAAQMLRQYCVH